MFLLWYRLMASRYFVVRRQEVRRLSSVQLISSSLTGVLPSIVDG